ncbi:hypothetical protein B0T14DRAFT_564452 [Immersiella caudata]|uniref:Aminoglycoside phosphotransferase domain-containing protein n=1 Tax=Immersiella caudata TaxID=314043 RepID=A0AA39WWR3_9PEZI|nr:hypothetical protein B0T14DRAFT_564452 [Immersiella caudata]
MASAADFFARHNLPTESRSLCLAFANSKYPDSHIREALSQGFCSFTLELDQTIIQFRPPIHQISLAMASAAYEIHGTIAPLTSSLGTIALPTTTPNYLTSPLHVYHMSRLPGIPLSSLQSLPPPHRRSLLTSYAKLLAKTWYSPSQPQASLIASTIHPRLLTLHSRLPSRFQSVISCVLASLPDILALPWVLTHGDFIPSNILVSISPTSNISGLLDWAEAEYLPFGICLYGLEELLGESVGGDGQEGEKYPAPGSVFGYYEDAEEMRAWFWGVLEGLVPEIRENRGTAEMAALLGILLWHGFAWDGGKLDRVVDGKQDGEEVQRLDAMLLGRVVN